MRQATILLLVGLLLIGGATAMSLNADPGADTSDTREAPTGEAHLPTPEDPGPSRLDPTLPPADRLNQPLDGG